MMRRATFAWIAGAWMAGAWMAGAWIAGGLFLATSPACAVAETPPAAQPDAAQPTADDDAEQVGPYPGTISQHSGYGFRDLVGRLKRAVAANGLTLVATLAGEAHGKAPASLVLLVTRADLPATIAEADPLAGMELPIRLYVMEDEHRRASIVYRTPSSIFALYDNPKLDALATDLDSLFAKLVDEAIGGS